METRKRRNYTMQFYSGKHAARIDVSSDWQIFSTGPNNFSCWRVDAFFISLVCEIRLKIHPARSSVRTSLSFLFARPRDFSACARARVRIFRTENESCGLANERWSIILLFVGRSFLRGCHLSVASMSMHIDAITTANWRPPIKKKNSLFTKRLSFFLISKLRRDWRTALSTRTRMVALFMRRMKIQHALWEMILMFTIHVVLTLRHVDGSLRLAYKSRSIKLKVGTKGSFFRTILRCHNAKLLRMFRKSSRGKFLPKRKVCLFVLYRSLLSSFRGAPRFCENFEARKAPLLF